MLEIVMYWHYDFKQRPIHQFIWQQQFLIGDVIWNEFELYALSWWTQNVLLCKHRSNERDKKGVLSMILPSIVHVSYFHVFQSLPVLSIYFVLKMCFCSIAFCVCSVVVCCSNHFNLFKLSFVHTCRDVSTLIESGYVTCSGQWYNSKYICVESICALGLALSCCSLKPGVLLENKTWHVEQRWSILTDTLDQWFPKCGPQTSKAASHVIANSPTWP